MNSWIHESMNDVFMKVMHDLWKWMFYGLIILAWVSFGDKCYQEWEIVTPSKLKSWVEKGKVQILAIRHVLWVLSTEIGGSMCRRS